VDEVRADAAAQGMCAVAIELAGLDGSTILALVQHAGQLGLEIVTGEDWAVIGGTASRLGALARPWGIPPPLADIAGQVGPLLVPESPATWLTARGPIQLDRPVILGILNLTPDSFSDGGRYLSPAAALAQADQLLADGAAILDLGGESTRPGSEPVPESEELARVLPVLEALVRRHPGVPISVDTVKAGVARSALEAGAAIVNDVSAFRLDPAMALIAAQYGAGVVLMHSRGTSRRRSWRSCGWPSSGRWPAGFPWSTLSSTPDSDSPRPPNRTSCSRTSWPRCARSGGRFWWVLRASAFWGA
jgi:hypothetical protein